MKNMIKQFKQYGLLAITVPLLSGCGGGGGFAGLGLGNLLPFVGPNNNGGGGSSLTDPDLLANIGHNPEPATMLLMGSGVAAMAYFKTRKK